LVVVLVQTCNVNGVQNHTKYLTREQVQQLKNLFDNVYKKLDNCKNREEANEIFKDIVLSINDLDLLPEDMTVEQAQKLVTGGEQNPKVMKLLERWYNNHKTSLDDNENVLCFMAGTTNETFFCGPVFSLLNSLSHRLLLSFLFLIGFLYPLNVLPFAFWNIFPLNLGYEVGIGSVFRWAYNSYYPAYGQVHTIGLNGYKSWNDSFWGNLSIAPIEFERDYLPGVFGFTGLDFVLDDEFTHFYFGFALNVKIDYNQPEF